MSWTRKGMSSGQRNRQLARSTPGTEMNADVKCFSDQGKSTGLSLTLRSIRRYGRTIRHSNAALIEAPVKQEHPKPTLFYRAVRPIWLSIATSWLQKLAAVNMRQQKKLLTCTYSRWNKAKPLIIFLTLDSYPETLYSGIRTTVATTSP